MTNRINWDQIEEVATKIKEKGLTLAAGAREFGIPVRKLYELNRRNRLNNVGKSITNDSVENDKGDTAKRQTHKEQPESEKSVDNKSEDPFTRSPLPEQIQRLIIDYRKENPEAGFKRIQDTLKSVHLVVVNRKKIRHVLKVHGMLEQNDSSFDLPTKENKGERRFEASYVSEMYQMDVSYIYLTGIPVLYLVVIIDDHSRYCVAAQLCHDQKADTLIGVLHDACIRYGKPKKLLSDQGSGFYSWSGRQTIFQQYLDDNRIEHIVSEPHSPQSQGKVERLIQTIKRECLEKVRFAGYSQAVQGIADYIRNYNYARPHQGIDGFCPADRFHGVIGERSRIEAALLEKELDFSKGYCIFKVQEHCVSVVSSAEGIVVLLDGKRLQEVTDEHSN